jgi:hypothetical protein
MGNSMYIMSRRGVLKGLVLSVVPNVLVTSEEKAHELRNQDIAFQVVIRKGKIVSRRLFNKLADETVDLPLDDFALGLDKGIVLTPSTLSLDAATQTADQIRLLFSSPAPNVEIRVEYHLAQGKPYLRKQIAVRQGKPTGLKLVRADLDLWKGVRRDWKSAAADWMRYGSHPIFCETMWAGVEFVAAFNEYDKDGFVLRSRPGGKPLGPEWLELHSTVVGVTRPDEARESFTQHYIDDIRQNRPRLVACYNSWWSLPEIFRKDELLALVREIKEKLYDKHGVFFDFVTADMGWSDPRSIWQVNQKDFPDGLGELGGVIESAGGKLGVWMSPSETYPPVMDYDWAENHGYVVVGRGRPKDASLGLSLADPKYRNQAKAQLQRLIKEHALGQVKYDGFIPREDRPHDDLLPGDDSVEPLAEYSLELIKASKEANPDLVAEPTYLNSWGNYISPWIIKYADSVWGNAGGDCPAGLGPAPDYRESQTSAREYFIFSSLHEVWLPQNAVQYFDIVHCDEAGGFPNHAAMAFGRGRFYVSTYINPKFMADADWEIYAGVLKWARRNQEVLQNTVILTSRVELGEPYAYAHWSGRRGIVAVRNPCNESKKFTLDLAKTGAPKEFSDGVCYTQYPYRKGILEGVSGKSTITLELAPWELDFLEIVPRPELPEPVAIGARWYRDSSGSMKVSSEGSSSIRILLPHGGEQVVTLRPPVTGDLRGEVLAQKIERLPEANWLRQGDRPLPTASFALESEISIPEGAAKGKVLLLLEFPGKEHLPSSCNCQVNGRAAALQESSSAASITPSGGHIGDTPVTAECPWRALLPYVSHWTWYICELESGSARVKFSGLFPDERSQIGLWVWAEWDLRSQSVAVSMQCPKPAMPPHEAHLKRRGICVLRPGAPYEPQPTEGGWTVT